jgi:hypothetical protein
MDISQYGEGAFEPISVDVNSERDAKGSFHLAGSSDPARELANIA